MNKQELVVISGHSDGLGKALAMSLGKDKVLGISKRRTNEFREICVDLKYYNYVSESVKYYYGHLDGQKLSLVLCAGSLGNKGGILDSKLSDWEDTIRINLLGNMAIIKAFLPHMLRVGYGKIIVVAGGGADRANPIFSGYSLSKVAIVREVENIAEEMKDKLDFSIIALAPGAMKTKMLEKVKLAGAEVKTMVEVEETVAFINKFLDMDIEDAKRFSGRFIHIRDNLSSLDFKNKWMLRRIQ